MSLMYNQYRQDFFKKLKGLYKEGYELKGLLSEPVHNNGDVRITARLKKDGKDYAYDSTGRWLLLNQCE